MSIYTVLRKVYRNLTPKGRRLAPWVLLAFLLMSVFEVFGVAAILPFMMLVARPALVESHPILHQIYMVFGFSSPRIFIEAAGMAVLLTLALGNFVALATTWISLQFAGSEQAQISTLLLRRYLSRPYVWFLERNTALLGRNVLSEAGTIPYGIVLPLMRLFSRILVVCLILTGLLCLNPLIALATSATLGGAYLCVWMFTRERLSSLGRERMAAEAAKYKLALEALNGIKATMVLGREETFLKDYSVWAWRSARILTSQGMLNESPRFLLETLAFGSVIAIVLVLIAHNGDVSVVLPLVSVFTLGAYRLMPALQQAFSYLSSIRGNLAALDFLDQEILDAKAVFRSLEREKPLRLTSEFCLKDIEFTYPGTEAPVIRGLSLRVKKNTSVALVGSTGAGKTTLVDILLGLLTPQKGVLEVDEVQLSEQSLRGWQANIGYVAQEVYLTDDSVGANIAFGVPKEEIDWAAVESAARLSNLHEFISRDLPDGYATVVGERGYRFSGGQRQRVGIARALYANPEVLVLDEATSSLDGLTESAVMEAVQRLSSQKTIVMIAHRFSTIQACDIIYLLENGKVVDEGSYDQLLRTNVKFQAMARAAESTPEPPVVSAQDLK